MSKHGSIDKLIARVRAKPCVGRLCRPDVQLAFLVPLVLVVLCVASTTALAASSAVPYPNSMAAMGDLLTLTR